MDAFLADMYGTNEIVGGNAGDVEKLAQAKFLDHLIKEETGLNYDQVDPSTIVKVAAEIFGANSLIKTAEDAEEAAPEEKAEEAEEKAEEAEEKAEEAVEEEAKEAQEKLAEADYLGRVMAHAYVNELAAIEKNASAKDTVVGAAKKVKDWASKPAKSYERTRTHGAVNKAGKRPGRFTALKAAIKENPYQALAGGGALATAGGGAALGINKLRKGKKKESSDLSAAVDARALELLKEAGYVEEPQIDFEEAAKIKAWEKLAEAGYDVDAMMKEAQAQQTVEQRALEMLAEAGYPVE
jgi:hypothetical protein